MNKRSYKDGKQIHNLLHTVCTWRLFRREVINPEWAALWSNYKTCEKLSLKLQNFNTVYLLLNYECSLFPYLAWWLRSLLSRYLCWMLINDWESQQLVFSKIRLHSLLFFAILECQSTCLRALSICAHSSKPRKLLHSKRKEAGNNENKTEDYDFLLRSDIVFPVDF